MTKKTGSSEKAKTSKVPKKGQRTSGVWKIAREGGEEKLNITIRINTKTAKDFRALCKKNELSISEVVEAFFKKELSQ